VQIGASPHRVRPQDEECNSTSTVGDVEVFGLTMVE
jgi:hypothetical protein